MFEKVQGYRWSPANREIFFSYLFIFFFFFFFLVFHFFQFFSYLFS